MTWSLVLLPALAIPVAATATAAAPHSTPALGVEEGRCRADESGAAFPVTVAGLKDRAGRLKLEVYPAKDHDFLADDNELVGAGRTFRRVRAAVPANDPVSLCVRLPGPGVYAVTVLQDRNGDDKFNASGSPAIRSSAWASQRRRTLVRARVPHQPGSRW